MVPLKTTLAVPDETSKVFRLVKPEEFQGALFDQLGGAVPANAAVVRGRITGIEAVAQVCPSVDQQTFTVLFPSTPLVPDPHSMASISLNVAPAVQPALFEKFVVAKVIGAAKKSLLVVRHPAAVSQVVRLPELPLRALFGFAQCPDVSRARLKDVVPVEKPTSAASVARLSNVPVSGSVELLNFVFVAWVSRHAVPQKMVGTWTFPKRVKSKIGEIGFWSPHFWFEVVKVCVTSRSGEQVTPTV